jgi:hypothetical protein
LITDGTGVIGLDTTENTQYTQVEAGRDAA